MNRTPLISAEGLVKNYALRGGKKLRAVSGISLDIFHGETLALAGESGCGKSTLGKMLIRLIQPSEGRVYFEGEDITDLSERELTPYRREMQLIFQDPYASLDPRMSVRDIIAEPLETHRVCASGRETTERVAELLEAVWLDTSALGRYAHQFSGGQRQRIGIARAVALHPKFIVCDEPVSALDVSVQNQILNLLRELQKKYSLTYLFISHDLSVVRFISDRVCIMFLGKLCEYGRTEEIYSNPLHPYTRFLLDAIPAVDPSERRRERLLLSGELPSPIDPPDGCRFCTRCPYATELCRNKEPYMREREGRMVACHLYD